MELRSAILIIAVITSIIRLAYIKNFRSILIVSIQTVAVASILLLNKTFGYYIFAFALLLSFFYPFLGKQGIKQKKNWIWLFLMPILIDFVFSSFHYPGYNIVRLLLLLPLVFFIYAIIKYKKFKYEIGIMIIFVADILIKLLGLII